MAKIENLRTRSTQSKYFYAGIIFLMYFVFVGLIDFGNVYEQTYTITYPNNNLLLKNFDLTEYYEKGFTVEEVKITRRINYGHMIKAVIWILQIIIFYVWAFGFCGLTKGQIDKDIELYQKLLKKEEELSIL